MRLIHSSCDSHVVQLAATADDLSAARQRFDGHALRVARENTGVTASVVAAAVGAAANSVARWENGAMPQVRLLARTERVLASLTSMGNDLQPRNPEQQATKLTN